MNFFEHQAQARAASFRLLILFALAVAGVVLGITGLCIFAMSGGDMTPEERRASAWFIATVVSLIILGASAYKTFALRDGGSAIAQQLGGVQINHHQSDYHYRRLVNVVEEMAIASGVPCPEIFVLEKEQGINAFAAGYSPADAAIAVTRGALMRLSRDELQGVIAHEFSHILNGDMRLNIRMIGLIFGLTAIGVIGENVMSSGGGNKEGFAFVIFGLALLILGYGGMFFGRIIKASIARNREYLADASAVQFSRQSDGLAGALKKAGGFTSGSSIGHSKRDDVEHMLFADGANIAKLFATHPDITDRIKRLDPTFNAAELTQLAQHTDMFDRWHDDQDPPSAASLLGKSTTTAPFYQTIGNQSIGNQSMVNLGIASQATPAQANAAMANTVAASVANPRDPHVGYAYTMRKSIANELRQAAHSREQVVDLLLGLVISPQEQWCAVQLQCVQTQLGTQRRQGVENLLAQIKQLAAEQKLPLASMAFPTLKLRSESELQLVAKCMRDLVNADGKIEVFEYCLARLLDRYIAESFAPSKTKAMGTMKLVQCREDLQRLFSVVASIGHTDANFAARAFQAGISEVLVGEAVSYLANANWLPVMDNVLPKLDLLLPFAKRQLVMALTTTMNFDTQITAQESELLRVLCAFLHCPLPPVLEAMDMANPQVVQQ